MLNNVRRRVLPICLAVTGLACLAMTALAKDEPNQSNPPNEDQQNQQDVSRDEGTTERGLRSADQQQPQSEQAQQSSQDQSNGPKSSSARDWPSPQRSEPEIGIEDRSISQPSEGGNEWRPDRSRSDSQRNERWSPDQEQSRSQRGASLGINIIRSDDGRGLIITRVHPDTPAQQMGLRSRDRIASINGDPVRSADEFISTIRSMNPGDEVELGIVRNENERTIRGELEPYNQALARNPEPSGNDEFRNYQGIIRDRSTSNQFSSDNPYSRDEGATERGLRSADRFSDADRGANRQTSYEEKNQPGRARSGDVEGRLSRIEQQLDRISQDIEELRNTIGSGRLSPERGTGTDFRTGTQSQPRASAPLPNGATLKKNDRWNTENRFDQADLQGARDRAAVEAARRQAEQTGARLQQQQGAANLNLQRSGASNPNAPQTPVQPPATQPPADQPPSK